MGTNEYIKAVSTLYAVQQVRYFKSPLLYTIPLPGFKTLIIYKPHRLPPH